jgi:hypothetical protein
MRHSPLILKLDSQPMENAAQEAEVKPNIASGYALLTLWLAHHANHATP